MYAPIPDVPVKVAIYAFAYLTDKLTLYRLSMMINLKNHKGEKLMQKSSKYIEEVHNHFVKCVSYITSYTSMIALAELQSIQTSHILWQELTNDNGSVSIYYYIACINVILLSPQKQYYIPQETHHSDFPCHIAVKDKDQQLLSYIISTYQTIKVLI